MNKWGIIGLGFISQRHVDAIKDIGDNLIAVCDIDRSKKEKFSATFFDDYKKMIETMSLDNVAICTPNHLHVEMAEHCLDKGIKVLCEKPLSISSRSINKLPNDGSIYTILQLRHNPEIQEIKEQLNPKDYYNGRMIISIHRDRPYFKSWKADESKSGGLLNNIGVHYFDLLYWFFGKPKEAKFDTGTDRSSDGRIKFKNAEIYWNLSIEAPLDNQIRKLNINGFGIDLTRHFEGLHTKVYRDFKNGRGILPREAIHSIKLIECLKRNSK